MLVGIDHCEGNLRASFSRIPGVVSACTYFNPRVEGCFSNSVKVIFRFEHDFVQASGLQLYALG